MKDWDDDDFVPPPLIESVKLEDEKFDIFQYEEYLFDCVKADANSHEMEKFPPPPLQNKSVSVWTFHEFKDASAQNLDAEGSSSGYTESDDEADDTESDDEADDKEEELEVGEELPPDFDLLTTNLKPDDGKPRNLLAETWICPECKKRHGVNYNLIADTQAFECSCQKQNTTSYNWSLTRVKLNGVSLDFVKVYQQKLERKCLLYAFLALCDMMRRVRGARHGWDEATPFDKESMLAFFKLTTGWDLECSRRLPRVGARQPHIELLLMAAVLHGVPYSSITRFDHWLMKKTGQKLSVPKRTMKVKSWFRVDRTDVATMVRLIANGIPLLAVIPLGKCFSILHDGEVYHTPKAEDGCITHAVVIHGSSITVPECDLSQSRDEGSVRNESLMANLSLMDTKPIQSRDRGSVRCEGVYFKCRNSHGTKPHPSWEKKGEGTDFHVWAADLLTDVYGINLLDFDD